MRKKLGTILLAISISTLLSSCLVDKRKAVEKISRTADDTLRIYQDGDYIEYNVTAIINTDTSTTTQYGTLRIKWEDTAPFQDPFGNFISPDLKETTSLTYDGNITGDPDATVIRYISQVTTAPLVVGEPGIGSISLHAIDDGTKQYYWPYPDGITPPDSPVITPVIFDSPMGFGPPPNSPQAFSVMQCTSNLCDNEIYKYNNSYDVVGDSREITTERGIFSNPFEVSFLGGIQPVGSQTLSFVSDVLDICGDSTENIDHNGAMFVMPQIGVIQMTNTCTNNTTGDSVNYVITIRETSFQF